MSTLLPSPLSLYLLTTLLTITTAYKRRIHHSKINQNLTRNPLFYKSQKLPKVEEEVYYDVRTRYEIKEPGVSINIFRKPMKINLNDIKNQIASTIRSKQTKEFIHDDNTDYISYKFDNSDKKEMVIKLNGAETAYQNLLSVAENYYDMDKKEFEDRFFKALLEDKDNSMKNEGMKEMLEMFSSGTKISEENLSDFYELNKDISSVLSSDKCFIIKKGENGMYEVMENPSESELMNNEFMNQKVKVICVANRNKIVNNDSEEDEDNGSVVDDLVKEIGRSVRIR